MSPTFGGKSVTHEEYLHLDAANSRTAAPTEGMIAQARHLDAGCPVSADLGEQTERLQAENTKLEGLRANYAVSLTRILQKAQEWTEADERAAAGLDAPEAPDIADRLRLVLGAVKTIRDRGRREWRK